MSRKPLYKLETNISTYIDVHAQNGAPGESGNRLQAEVSNGQLFGVDSCEIDVMLCYVCVCLCISPNENVHCKNKIFTD